MEATAQLAPAAPAAASERLFIPNGDGTWNYFPNGFWRVGYQIDEPAKQRVQEITREQRMWMLISLTPCIAVPLLRLFVDLGPIGHRTVFGSLTTTQSTDIGMLLGLMICLTPVSVWTRLQIREVTTNFSLSRVMISRRQARARWFEYWRQGQFFGAKFAYLCHVLPIIIFGKQTYEALAQGTLGGYVGATIWAAMTLGSFFYLILITIRLLDYRQDLREGGPT